MTASGEAASGGKGRDGGGVMVGRELAAAPAAGPEPAVDAVAAAGCGCFGGGAGVPEVDVGGCRGGVAGGRRSGETGHMPTCGEGIAEGGGGGPGGAQGGLGGMGYGALCWTNTAALVLAWLQ